MPKDTLQADLDSFVGMLNQVRSDLASVAATAKSLRLRLEGGGKVEAANQTVALVEVDLKTGDKATRLLLDGRRVEEWLGIGGLE